MCAGTFWKFSVGCSEDGPPTIPNKWSYVWLNCLATNSAWSMWHPYLQGPFVYWKGSFLPPKKDWPWFFLPKKLCRLNPRLTYAFDPGHSGVFVRNALVVHHRQRPAEAANATATPSSTSETSQSGGGARWRFWRLFFAKVVRELPIEDCDRERHCFLCKVWL